MKVKDLRSLSPLCELNVTPLVDVLLVLLIIFMVTAPLLKESLSIQLPETEGAPLAIKSEEEWLVIKVFESHKIQVEDQFFSTSQLSQHLKHRLLKKAQTKIVLESDQKVPYGYVAEVLSVIQKSGCQTLHLATQPVSKEKNEVKIF